ncbi:MAG: SGNH/GDSL hydrolase family protein [Magnetospirillum sp.]|nr:SGNH/GDSL hydrolase family protein [Magnetospirillum sp.]
MKPQGRSTSWLKTSFILSTVLLIFAAALEAGARFYLWHPTPEGQLGRVRYGFTPSGLGDLHPNQDGVYTAHPALPYHVVANRDGFRNRQDIVTGKPTILALGDSQTFGLFTHAHDVWTDWLQFQLARQGRDLQVLNNGIPGASIKDTLDYYRTKGIKLRPDFVLLCVYMNDIADLKAPITIRQQGMEMEQQVRFSDLRWFLRQNSALYDLAKSIRDAMTRTSIQVANHLTPVNSPDPERAQSSAAQASLPFEQYESLFVEFDRLVRTEGGKLAVAFLPAPNTARANAEISRFVEQLSRRHDVPFLDLTPALATRSVDEAYLIRSGDSDYPNDIHLSRTGHMLVAEALVPFVSTHFK